MFISADAYVSNASFSFRAQNEGLQNISEMTRTNEASLSHVFSMYTSVLNCEKHSCADWMVGSLVGCIIESVGCGEWGESYFSLLH